MICHDPVPHRQPSLNQRKNAMQCGGGEGRWNLDFDERTLGEQFPRSEKKEIFISVFCDFKTVYDSYQKQ